MSLILDALKKSERERQRDKAPGLQSIHQPPLRHERRTNRTLWLVASIVVVNALVLFYWRAPSHKDAVPSGVPSVASKTTAEPIQPAVRDQGSVANADGAASSPAPEFTRIVPAQASAAQTPDAPAMRVEEVSELPEEVRNNLPAMTFSFHVYSSNAQQRTIIINNRRMREGEEISSGLELLEITDDGVILRYQQHRIHIGVLSGW